MKSRILQLWRDDPRPLAISPLIVDGFRRATCPRACGPGPIAARVAAPWMGGRRDQANRATVHPAQLAMLPRLEAKTRPARSKAMAVVRSKAISAEIA